MGRKSRLPLSKGSAKKSESGLPAFFKHRKQQEQLQQQQEQLQQQQEHLQQLQGSQSSSAFRESKGKQRNSGSQDLIDSVLLSVTASHDDLTAAAASVNAGRAEDLSWSSGYEHLSARNFQGATKDSSVRAYGRYLRSLIEQSDVLIQVLDARDPMGSRSTSTEALIAANPGKKLLFVLTKIDLVPKKVLQAWLQNLRQWYPTLAFKSASNLSSGRASRKLHTLTNINSSSAASSSLEGSTAATLIQLLKNYARSQPSGMSLTVGIFGQPNVGKSSLINSLVRSRVCSVAPRPGETKNLQTILLDRKVRLIDSPGVAMSAIARAGGDLTSAKTAEVLQGTVKLELVEDPIIFVAEILKRADPIKVTKLYGLPPLNAVEKDVDKGEHNVRLVPQPEEQAISVDQGASAGSHVDFESMRKRTVDSDDEDEDDLEGMEHHKDTFFDDEKPAAGELEDDEGNTTASHWPSNSSSGVGYDITDPMDFLLRLTLIKGKMLRGGKPDVEGAARAVINDWNAGRISWHVKPPTKDESALRELEKSKRVRGLPGKSHPNEETLKAPAAAETISSRVGEEPLKNEEATLVTGFSQAFDLDALFAQADAQLFGGEYSTFAKTFGASKVMGNRNQNQALRKAFEAADLSTSSLGKRGIPFGSDDEDEDDASTVDKYADTIDDESDSDAHMACNKRMEQPSAPNEAATGGNFEEDEVMQPRQRRGPKQSMTCVNFFPVAEELSSYLAGETGPGNRSKAPTHIIYTQKQQREARDQHVPASASTNKRGQRQKKGTRTGLLQPAYLDRQLHKASLPTNIRKNCGEERGNGLDADPGLGSVRAKKRKERRKKRKMARRSEARGDDVWQGLQEVTLD